MTLFDACCRFATLLFAALLSGQVAAKPISIRGINWAMSEAEQVSALESQGLMCVKEVGWDEIYPRSNKLGELEPVIACIQSANNQQKINQLRTYFKEFTDICDHLGKDGYVSRKCLSFEKFNRLKDSVVKVRYKDHKIIIFSCEFVGTCGFDWKTIVAQLRRKVISKVFSQPSANSFVVCADGDDGDAVCLHGYSKDIWLLRQPMKDNMKF